MKRIYLVEHAVERAFMRGVTESQIRDVIENPDLKGTTRNGRTKVEKELDGQILRVIYKETSRQYIVITVIWRGE